MIHLSRDDYDWKDWVDGIEVGRYRSRFVLERDGHHLATYVLVDRELRLQDGQAIEDENGLKAFLRKVFRADV